MKFTRLCYYELCLYQTLFRNDSSQKITFTRKDIPENDCIQLDLEGYLTGLGENSMAVRINFSYIFQAFSSNFSIAA